MNKAYQLALGVIKVEILSLFQQYCQHLGINLTFSKAYHHSGSPAKWAIRKVKGLVKCCTMAKQSWRLALMEYLATPLDSNTPSPSELNGCRYNSLLPNISNSKYSNVLVEHHGAQLQHDTRSCTLPELPVGSKVRYRNHITNKFDVGIVSARDARLYMIHTEHGRHVSRNRIDLKQTDAPIEQKTDTQPVSNFAKSKHAPPQIHNSNVKCTANAKLILKRVEISKSNKSNSMYTTYSGCISKPAKRLITQM